MYFIPLFYDILLDVSCLSKMESLFRLTNYGSKIPLINFNLNEPIFDCLLCGGSKICGFFEATPIVVM